MYEGIETAVCNNKKFNFPPLVLLVVSISGGRVAYDGTLFTLHCRFYVLFYALPNHIIRCFIKSFIYVCTLEKVWFYILYLKAFFLERVIVTFNLIFFVP